MPLRLHNTLTKAVEEFVPADASCVTFYSCGPTVYDDQHVGNFRSFLAADTLRRFIESPLCELRAPDGTVHRGRRRVVHVMNVTDVGHMTDDAEGGENGEDRMAVAGRRLLEAKKSGRLPPGEAEGVDPSSPLAVARFYESRFRADARALGLRLALEAQADPTLMPRATGCIDGMIALVRRLMASGHAYSAGVPGARAVYFRVQSFGPYGRLSGNTLAALRAGEGGRVSADNQSQKEHPADFLLWKEDPRHIMSWEADFGGPGPAWGKGYPGWHIECTVMAAARLAAPGRHLSPDELATLVVPGGRPLIDLHSGGEDNIFPHHDCEIAQSCCAFNAEPGSGTFARLWFHPRHLFINGQKMSKSKGNFFTIRDLLALGHQPGAVRLSLIWTHYRSNADFTEQGARDAQRVLDRWRRVLDAHPGAEARPEPGSPAARALAGFSAAMHEDLNVAAAIAAINTWVGEVGAAPAPADSALMALLDGVLGVLGLERAREVRTDIGVFVPPAEPTPEVLALLARRAQARAAKDFPASDRARDELAALGLAIKDIAGGKVEVRRKA